MCPNELIIQYLYNIPSQENQSQIVSCFESFVLFFPNIAVSLDLTVVEQIAI